MLFCPVFAATHPRQSLDSLSGSTPAPRPLTPNSHGIISFADPHPLNSVVSYRYKNIGGSGVFLILQTFNFRFFIHPLYFLCVTHPSPQRAFLNHLFINHLRTLFIATGDVPLSATFGRPTFGRSNLFPSYPPPFHTLAHSFALFCSLQKLNPFVFKRFRTLCKKHRGWGGNSHSIPL